ncbi:unnamed protein product [Phytophthora lilii]|uniref:Poly [ADP-ribose] polymerase n=1 Tax=Phytophthora lilii TaxID=2077276 RepID=A0A9W6TJH4_9STRA|nr:unnamed protein product [Phytophthora lilii]
MLNLTDISYGTFGNNKFYMGQLIVDRGAFVLFRKWGRVGAKSPQSQTQRFASAEAAEQAFRKVFQAKSGNKWPLAQPFQRKKGKRKAKAKAKGPSAAAKRTVSALRQDLKAMSSEFYSLIPHDFGRSLPPVIATMADLKLKLELLEVLSNLEISQALQKEEAEKPKGPAIHPLDMHYGMLNTNMEPLNKRGKEYKIIEKCVFIQKTNGGSKLTINTILKIARPDEETHKDVLGSLDNHKVCLSFTTRVPEFPSADCFGDLMEQLLWHGSRLSNFVGILSQGLRIAPPEAPENGYQFGKGVRIVLIADGEANMYMVARQAILLLADVALGTPFKTPSGQFLDYKTVKGQRGCDSTHGLGRMAPAEDEFETLPDGVVVPAGTLKPVDGNQYLLYNEFIVYRREQVQLRYLVAVDFQNVACAWTSVAMSPRWLHSFSHLTGQNKTNGLTCKLAPVAMAPSTAKRVDPLSDCASSAELDDEVPEEEKDEKMSEIEEEEEVLSALHETVQDVLKISQGYALLQQLSAALKEIDELNKVVATKQETPAAKKPGTRRSTRVKRTANPNAAQIRRLKNSLKTLSSDFYTLIPHDFGRNLPPPIDSMDEVKLKIDLLEVLANIEISRKLQAEKIKNAKKNASSDQPKLNSLDAQYNLLKVKMEPLAESTDEFKTIQRYSATEDGNTTVSVVI